MRTTSTALAALVAHASLGAHALDFGTGAASEPVLGQVGTGSARSDTPLVISIAPVPSSSRSRSIRFNDAGSLDVGTLDVGAPATNAPAINDSEVVIITNSSTRFSVLPPSSDVDLQGFPFLASTPAPANANATAQLSTVVALQQESDEWIARVCSGKRASCEALQPPSTALVVRRLAADTDIDTAEMQKTIEDFLHGALVEGGTDAMTNLMTNGLMIGAATAFSLVLGFALPGFAENWEKVTDALKAQADAVLKVANKAASDLRFITEREQLHEAVAKAGSMGKQRLSKNQESSLRTLCGQDGGAETNFKAFLSNAKKYRETLNAYCGASHDCVVGNGVYYVKSMIQPYSNSLACFYDREKDKAKLKARAIELRTDINTVIADFLNDAENVRNKLMTKTDDDPNVDTVDDLYAAILKMDEKAANDYINQHRDAADLKWLDFAVYVSDSTSTDCKNTYKYKVYVEQSKDKGVGMLYKFDQKKTVVLAWKQKDVDGGKLVSEKLSSPADADARADALKKECGETNVHGMVLLPLHGEPEDISVDWHIQRRRLVQAYKCGGYRLIAVCGPTYKNTTYDASKGTFDESKLDAVMDEATSAQGGSTELTPEVVSNYFNSYGDDMQSQQKMVDDFGTQDWVRTMAQRDPAVLAYAGFGLELINEVTKREVQQIDHVGTVLDQTHAAQVTALNNVNNKLIETHGKEMTGLKNMENDMAKYHREEIQMYDTIDGHVAALGSTIDQGFATANSQVSAVESAVTGKLGSLNDLVASTAQETRQKVVSFLRETTQQTISSLNALEGHINKVDEQTLESVGVVRNAIVETQSKLRQNIATEFQKQEIAFQNHVADTNQVISDAGTRVMYALLRDVDMVNTALIQQLDGVGTHVDVVKDRLVTVEKGFDDLQVQVDKMLALLSTIQQRTNRIFRTLQNFPQKVAAILLQGEVKKRLDDFKKLNYAFTRFVENGMRPLYRSELILACDTYAKAGDLLYYFTSNVGVEGGMDAVVKHFRKFEFNRNDYEKFGGQTIVAAYGVQRLSLTCAFLKEDLTREQFIERAVLWDKEIDAAMYRFQMNVEEVIPRYFLTQHYTAEMLQGYLTDAKMAAGISSTSTDFPLESIEQLRYRIQQDVGVFAQVSVVQTLDKSALSVWTKLSTLPDKSAQNRQGISMQLPNTVILWSNTPKELSIDVRDLMKLPLKPEDVANASTLDAAFRGTVLDKYWTTGVIRTVVYTAKVAVAGSAKACPWAISSSHYPLCWEVSNLSGGGCVCVQMEGIVDTLKTAELTEKHLAPSFYSVKTTLVNPDEPRSNFVINATATAVPLALAANELVGVPTNRVSFAACMSAPLPPVECNITNANSATLCHQPPPPLKRCIADKNNAYSIVYDTTPSDEAAPLIEKGLTVTAEMFRTLELGATLPQISFFDELNGNGNYVVCKNCVMSDFKTVYMFRIQSFKIGRPIQEKDSVCITHPRLKNVEYCPRRETRPVLWTSQVLVETELIQRVQQIGDSIPEGVTDPQTLASLLNDGIQELLNTDFAYFKVYVAKNGSFNATTNSAYWTSLPTHVQALERGWTVLPAFYTTINDDDKVVSFDALVMWSTLPVQERNFAKLVVDKKPSGQTLKGYLEASFAAYNSEKILRGFFSEPFDDPDCPVAGDTDHFAYCTPVPVDKMCLCVQLEDLPEEYTELYDGSAPNGKVVSFPLDDAQSAYVVGRTKGSFSLGTKEAVGTWDGFPMRNVSARSVCVSDYNHPELGATCVSDDGTSAGVHELLPPSAAASTSSGMLVGEGVDAVTIEAPTWSAQCTSCTGPFVAQILQQGGAEAAVRVGGYIGGGECRNGLADGGGILTLCLK